MRMRLSGAATDVDMQDSSDDFGQDSDNALAGFRTLFDREARPACQLYLISPPSVDTGFADALRRALDGGPVAAFQLRLKGVGDDDIRRAADALMPVCREADVSFILNDRADLAKALGADGVHLGQGDGDPRAARRLLGPEAQIGVTCHDSRHLAMEAGEAGADYVAFGAFYPTTTKEVRHRPDPAILGWWTTLFEVPCVAIGGITAANAAPLVQAGADFIAVSGAVWSASGSETAAVKALLAAIA
jgi:thiamine-phosphate pyrophosphorylase